MEIFQPTLVSLANCSVISSFFYYRHARVFGSTTVTRPETRAWGYVLNLQSRVSPTILQHQRAKSPTVSSATRTRAAPSFRKLEQGRAGGRAC
jgi:hypothetical protein